MNVDKHLFDIYKYLESAEFQKNGYGINSMKKLLLPLSAMLLWFALSMPATGQLDIGVRLGRIRNPQALCRILGIILERPDLSPRVRRILERQFERFCASPFNPTLNYGFTFTPDNQTTN